MLAKRQSSIDHKVFSFFFFFLSMNTKWSQENWKMTTYQDFFLLLFSDRLSLSIVGFQLYHFIDMLNMTWVDVILDLLDVSWPNHELDFLSVSHLILIDYYMTIRLQVRGHQAHHFNPSNFSFSTQRRMTLLKHILTWRTKNTTFRPKMGQWASSLFMKHGMGAQRDYQYYYIISL